ncbi:hypothetical protein NE237_020839 [Protea cynaroides]|uniref:Uncharacterized protein n=1 Tax=Protea cynaroides TaxID=273540 RepID=A0A9Q0H7Z6_9MAGN|nr:hypothetical protein NE237_020839 [Protea cynaroides]
MVPTDISKNFTSGEIQTASNNVRPISASDNAHPTSSSARLVISIIASLIPIKLNATDYLLWKSLFEPILRASGSTVSDDDILIFILDGLPSTYRQFYSSIRIRTSTTVLLLEELHNLLLCEEIAVVEEAPIEQPTVMAASCSPLPMHGGRGSSYRGSFSLGNRGHSRYSNRNHSSPCGLLPPPAGISHGTRPIC